MPKKKIKALNDLRASITNRQREILDDIWHYIKKHNMGLPERPLLDRFGKQALLQVCGRLGGSILYSNHEENKFRYNLDLVGIFLTTQGQHLENVVERYLVVLRDAYANDKEIERFSSKELASWAPDLTADDLVSLRHILYRSYGALASSIGGWNAEEWFVSVDNEVVELKNVKNWSKYIDSAIMKRYNPQLPADEKNRVSFNATASSPDPVWNSLNKNIRPRKNRKPSPAKKFDLSFIDDDAPLRNILENDWMEAYQHIKTKSWKSCVLLCAGVVEGLLLWQLEHAQRATSTSQGTAIDIRYDGEVLSAVIRMSKEQHLIGEDELFLTEWARLFRNTIHPGNQRRTDRTPIKKDADLALKVAQVMAEGIRKRARK